jgi:hypothetical protein
MKRRRIDKRARWGVSWTMPGPGFKANTLSLKWLDIAGRVTSALDSHLIILMLCAHVAGLYGPMYIEIREDASVRRRVQRIERELQMNDLTPCTQFVGIIWKGMVLVEDC